MKGRIAVAIALTALTLPASGIARPVTIRQAKTAIARAWSGTPHKFMHCSQHRTRVRCEWGTPIGACEHHSCSWGTLVIIDTVTRRRHRLLVTDDWGTVSVPLTMP